ncbi:MAG: lamin tail domain-containing protein [Candidatus Omnitrophica bacterium]|nr:lamin tail domain-containing protein [Candidatus Omnitrophota bacterium]
MRAGACFVCALAGLSCVLNTSARASVVFNEIMYHPGTNQAALQWIELHNQMAVDMDLSHWTLGGGVQFTFPEKSIIKGGGYLVIAAAPVILTAATGLRNISGPFAGQLSNAGEKLDLRNNSGRIIDTINYEDDYPWPVATDGSGASLAKINPDTASDLPENWTSSAQVGGTPGSLNFPPDDPQLTSLVSSNSPAKLRVPDDDQFGSSWTDIGFDDADWADSTDAIGYDSAEVDLYFQAVMADQPDGYWRLDETNGPTAFDFSGHGRHGTYNGGVTLGVGGALPAHDAAARFDGTSGFVQLPGTWGGTSQLTIEAWVNTDDPITGDFQSMVSTPDGGFAHFQIHTTGNTGAYTSSGFTLLTPPPPTPTGAWRYIALVVEPGNSRVYVNGVQFGATDVTQFNTIIPASLNDPPGARGVRIANGHMGRRYFYGRIDEVAIYSTALSAERIQAHYLAGTSASFLPFFGTSVEASLHGKRTGAYLRIPFQIDPALPIDSLKLRIRYADGFFAYLNGHLVVSRNAPPAPSFDAAATLDRDKLDAIQPEDIDLTQAIGWLRLGATNVLAIQGLNRQADSPDFLIAPELLAHYSHQPMPLALNEISLANAADFQVEIINRGLATINLEGCVLADSSQIEGGYTLPSHPLGPAEFLTLSAAELGFAPKSGDKLFLYSPARCAVLDAVAAKNHARGRSPDGTGPWLRVDSPTFGSSNHVVLHDEVVINEIMYHAPVVQTTSSGQVLESPEQWIELYNRSDHQVDMTGWQVTGGLDYQFPGGTVIQPGGYSVVANDPGPMRALHPGILILGPSDKHLSHRTDLVQLRDANRNPVDEVRYFDGGRWPAFADGGGSTLELRDPRADNSKAEAWAASNEGAKSSWHTYTYRGTASASLGPDSQWKEFVLGLLGAGEVWLDDIRVTENPGGAAVQLIQNGDFSAGTNAWRIVGNHHGEVIDDPEQPGNKVLRLVARGPTEHWSNHAETTLAGGRSIVNGRLYEISYRAKSIAGDNQLNSRLYFNRLPRTTRLERPALHGTPGAPNSRFQTNIGPTFAEFKHEPSVPASGQPVTVTVTAADPDRVDAVTLWWSVNGEAWNHVTMMDQGQDRYTAGLPGLPGSTLVQFYAAATDRLGAQSFFPSSGPGSRALYKVNDGQARLSLTHNFRIIMTTADANLMYLNSNLMSNDPLGATVVYDESQLFYDVGVRLKGSPYGRPYDQFVSFAVEFQPDNPFRGLYESVNVDRSGRGPVGSPGQDEILIKHIINHAGGIPGEYDDLAWVIAPRSQHTSSALLTLAHYTNPYLDSLYPDGSDSMLFEFDGAYYPTQTSNGKPDGPKVVEPGPISYTDIRDLGTNKEAYRWNFIVKNNHDRDDYTRILALAKAFSLTGTALDTASQQTIDVNEWLRTFAVLSLVGIGDAYTQGNPHNLWLYVRPTDQRILALPHDNDVSFSRPVNAPLTGDNGNLLKVIALPANRRLFYHHLQDIISTTFNTSYMAYWTGHYDNFLSSQNFSSILTYIGQRANSVLSQLPARIPFSITTQNGRDFMTGQASVQIQGNAWIDVSEIHLPNELAPLAITWLTPTRWQATVPLVLGTNQLMFLASNYQGNLAASNAITVTSTAASGALDTDHDGMPDAWELTHDLAPALPDADEDPDCDGQNNLQEYLAGTDPHDARSRLKLAVTRNSDQTVTLTFTAAPGRSYTLQRCNPLTERTWNTLANFTPQTTNRFCETQVPLSNRQEFYRITTPSLP